MTGVARARRRVLLGLGGERRRAATSEPSPRRSGGGLEDDSVAEGLKLGQSALAGSICVALYEVVATEIVVVAAFGEQMPGDDQDGVGDGDGRLLLADPSGQAPELGRQVGVTAAGCTPGALVEDLAQPAV